MASQRIIIKAKGLYTHPNLLSEVPDGALVVADDVVIDRDGIIEPRRGFTRMADSVTGNLERIFVYQDTLLIHHNNATLRYRNGSVWTALTGTFAAPNATTSKMHTAEANKNFYFTTSAGVYRLDAYNGTPLLSGVQKPPGFERDQRVATAIIGAMERIGTTVTVTTSAAHGFYVGQVVNMNTAGEANFVTGNKTVVAAATSTTFTYTEAGAATTNGTLQTFVPAQLAGATGILVDASQFAYRVTFTYPDANGNFMESAPSSRFVLTNASGTPGWITTESKNPVLRVLLPTTLSTSHSVNLYRSPAIASTIEPSEELGLVFSRKPNSAEVARGYMDVTDVVPDALRSTTIYTAPSQDGIALANERPPLAKDLAVFGGSTWYANTVGLPRFEFSILGVGGATGIQNGDSIAFSGDISYQVFGVYDFVTATPTTATQVKLETSGTASQNIRNTALNLVAAINRNASDTVYAYYVSADSDAPGKIIIEGRTPGAATLYPYLTSATVNSSASTAPRLNNIGIYNLARAGSTVTATVSGSAHSFVAGQQVYLAVGNADFPAGVKLIVTSTATTFTYTESGSAVSLATQIFYPSPAVTYSSESKPGRVYYSKTEQSDAVPLFNYFDIGKADADILRVVPTRTSLFVFKEDGLFRIVGANGAFEVQQFDPTVILLCPDSAVQLQNQVFGMSTQGIVAVSDTGVDIVSRPIEFALNKIKAQSLANFKNLSYGIAYESDRKYIFGCVNTTSDTWPTKAWTYNTVTSAWTRWGLQRRYGIVNPVDDKLYVASAAGSYVHQERKAFTSADYSDADAAITIVSVVGNVVNLGSAAGVARGDVIVQGSYYALVDSVLVNAVTCNANGQQSEFTAAAATVYTSIASSVQWAPITGDAPGKLKTFQDTEFLFANAHIPRFTYGVSTELNRTVDSTIVDTGQDSTIAQWTTPDQLWDGTDRPVNVRLYAPQAYRMADRLNVIFSMSAAFGCWALNGIAQLFKGGSDRSSR